MFELVFIWGPTQHISSLKLLEKVRELLGCGTITKKSSTVIRYQIDSIVTINSTLIPFTYKYPLYTKKAEHYAIFKKVCDSAPNKKQTTCV
jgi:hypothetical protein